MLKIFNKLYKFKGNEKIIYDDKIDEINHFYINNKHKTLLWYKAALELSLYK